MNTTNQANFPLSSLYVGDLHPDTTEAMLYEKFSQSGPVLSIRVCRDLVTRRSLGYAYVNFQQPGDAERALDSMNFDDLKGNAMRIMWSQRDPSLRKSGLGNIFIKNLDKTIDNKQLYDTFNQFGNILSCKIVKDDKCSSKGYGFVHFESDEAAIAAIEEVNGMMLQDRKVFVGRFKNRGDRVREVGEKNRQFTNVFIKNLPLEYTEEELKALVDTYGNTLSVKLMTDDDSGKSKSFGFASFGSHEEADAAVDGINEKEVKGKVLYAGRAQKKNERVAELRINYEKRKHDRQQKYAGVNLYVKNLDDSVNDETLKKEFAQHGAITSAKVMIENGASKGFGFVCYTNPDEAQKAVSEMNGRIVGSKPLYVAMAQRKEDRKAHLQQQYMRGAGPASSIRQPTTTPQFGAQGYPYSNQQIGSLPYYTQMGMNSPGPKFQAMPMNQRGGMPGLPRPQTGYGPGMGRHMNLGGQQRMAMPNVRPNMYNTMNVRPQMQQVMNIPGMNINNIRPQGPGGYPNNMMQNPDLPAGYKMNANVRNNAFPIDNMNNMANIGHMQNIGQLPNQQIGNHNQNPQINQQIDINNNQAQGDNMMPQASLDARELARVPQDEQKQLIGEKLYPLVKEYCGEEDAGKVTGMILELENEELLTLIDKPGMVRDKVNEAKQVLDKAMRESENVQN